MYKPSILAAAVVLAACGSEPERTYIPPPLAASDTDGDGTVTREEWIASGDALFSDLDTDGDGVLRDSEIDSGFAVLDRDGDGVLEPGEVDAASIDPDGDGQFNRTEWQAAPSIDALDADRSGTLSRDEFRRSRLRVFEDLDRDRNGRLRQTEIPDESRIDLLRF